MNTVVLYQECVCPPADTSKSGESFGFPPMWEDAALETGGCAAEQPSRHRSITAQE